MPPTKRSFYLLNTRTICVIVLYNYMQCVDGFSILLQRYVTKVTMQRPSNFQLLFVTERAQLRTFARNYSNIDFFLKILPLKDDELAMSEM